MVFTDFEGTPVRLTDERWRHVEEHPEMVGLKDSVDETLRDPDVVVQSASDEQARLYYRFYQRTLVGGKHLCVVVKATTDDAFVVTAYLTDRAKRGKILWQRES
ncbi:MAG TPA: PBECR2 nuclease fold domain-containing protein [Terriglobales bacterium]